MLKAHQACSVLVLCIETYKGCKLCKKANIAVCMIVYADCNMIVQYDCLCNLQSCMPVLHATHHAIHHGIAKTIPARPDLYATFTGGASFTWHTKGCCNCGIGDIIMCWSNASAAKDHTVWSNTLLQSQNSLPNVIYVIRNVLCSDKINTLPSYSTMTTLYIAGQNYMSAQDMHACAS